MSQEFFEFRNLIVLRRDIKVVDPTNSVLSEIGQPVRDLFRNRASDNFKNNFSRYLRWRHGEYNTPAYRLAGYLDLGAENMWEGLAELMSSVREIERAAGALMFDMGMGIRDVIYPLMEAHGEYTRVASELQEQLRPFGNKVFNTVNPAAIEQWAELRARLAEDPTGFLLIGDRVSNIRNGNFFLQFTNRKFVTFGAEVTQEIYQELYPTVDQIMSTPSKPAKFGRFLGALFDRFSQPFHLV